MKARLALLSCLVLLAAPSAAQMYKWVDEKGVTHYSEKPPPGRKAQQIQPAPSLPAAAPGASASPKPADPSSTWSDRERDFRRRAIEREEAAQNRQKKEDDERQRVAMRRELCMEAHSAIEALNANRPVYWMNEKGEREFLEDSARPAALRRAKEKVETYCKPE